MLVIEPRVSHHFRHSYSSGWYFSIFPNKSAKSSTSVSLGCVPAFSIIGLFFTLVWGSLSRFEGLCAIKSSSLALMSRSLSRIEDLHDVRSILSLFCISVSLGSPVSSSNHVPQWLHELHHRSGKQPSVSTTCLRIEATLPINGSKSGNPACI